MKFDLGPHPLGTLRPRQKSLEEIEDALQRLETGEFGYCKSCGAPISVKRLCQDPTTSLCVRCEDTPEPADEG